jgi:hypothetical protein
MSPKGAPSTPGGLSEVKGGVTLGTPRDGRDIVLGTIDVGHNAPRAHRWDRG